jgi:predicted small metal-binding protein
VQEGVTFFHGRRRRVILPPDRMRPTMRATSERTAIQFYIKPIIQARSVRSMQEIKTFRCKDLGLACEFEEKAESENELMKRIEGHVQTAHQMNPEQPEVQEKIRKAIK